MNMIICSVPDNIQRQGVNKEFWGVNRCESPHIFSSLPFILSGQVVSFLGFLTWDPSLIWSTAYVPENGNRSRKQSIIN